LKHLLNNNIFASPFTTTGCRKKYLGSTVFKDSIFQKNMENVSLSIKEEIADETQNGSSNLHLEEDSNKVM